MHSLAIVTAFSEDGYPVLKQCLASCDQCIAKDAHLNIEVTAFCYECNWDPYHKSPMRPFEKNISIVDDFPLKHIKLNQKKASIVDLKYTRLPDIAIYDDFARKYLDDFDYVMFCHDDIHFNDISVFSEAINILSNNKYNIIATPVIDCTEYLSIRYRPHFIMVHSKKFRESNLSFANEYTMLDLKYNVVRPGADGGAGLLCSQFHPNNSSGYNATNTIPHNWVRHLRFDFCDLWIENYNVFYPTTKELKQIARHADRTLKAVMYIHQSLFHLI